MLAIVALSAAFLAPLTAWRSSNAHNDRATRLVLNDIQLATPEAAQAASFEEGQVLGAQLADILAAS